MHKAKRERFCQQLKAIPTFCGCLQSGVLILGQSVRLEKNIFEKEEKEEKKVKCVRSRTLPGVTEGGQNK